MGNFRKQERICLCGSGEATGNHETCCLMMPRVDSRCLRCTSTPARTVQLHCKKRSITSVRNVPTNKFSTRFGWGVRPAAVKESLMLVCEWARTRDEVLRRNGSFAWYDSLTSMLLKPKDAVVSIGDHDILMSSHDGK